MYLGLTKKYNNVLGVTVTDNSLDQLHRHNNYYYTVFLGIELDVMFQKSLSKNQQHTTYHYLSYLCI